MVGLNPISGILSLGFGAYLNNFNEELFLFTHYSCNPVVHSTTCDPLPPTVQIGITQSLSEPLFDVSTRQAPR
jgi:hypothetical protein